jgi:AraC-like DNA-binding protein
VISELFEKIERDYTERITIPELAEIAGVTEKYLCRFFKEVTGHTPTDYINRVRVEHACYEMKFNHRNVTEAAYESGFNEIGYFYKCFKKYKGIPPGKYMKSL